MATAQSGDSVTNRPMTPQKQDLTRLLIRFREASILIVLLVLMVLVWLRNPLFLSSSNLRSIMLDIPLILVVGMGMTTIILSRNIDLSVGSTLGLCAVVVGITFRDHPAFPIWAGALLGIGLGALLGAFNGLLVTWLRVPAIIATLGTLSVYRGLVFIVSSGRQIEPFELPPALIALSQGSPLVIPWIVIFALVVVAAMHFFLRFSRTGREIYAIGSNPVAARLRGILVERTLFLTFVLTGALSGLAGVMSASRFGFVYPAKVGVGFELSVIAATIIGGTNVLGGSGSVIGTVLGCILLGVIQNALNVAHFSPFWQLAIYGVIILVAVGADAFIRRRLEQAAIERRGR